MRDRTTAIAEMPCLVLKTTSNFIVVLELGKAFRIFSIKKRRSSSLVHTAYKVVQVSVYASRSNAKCFHFTTQHVMHCPDAVEKLLHELVSPCHEGRTVCLSCQIILTSQRVVLLSRRRQCTTTRPLFDALPAK